MTTADIIYERAKTLPEAQAREVLDFLEYLQGKLEKHSPPSQEPKNKAPETLPGFGMWANRPDMSDTREYLRNLRKPRYTL